MRCSGFFASRKGLFDEGKLSKLMQNLENGEADLLYPFAPEQSLLNYMLMRSDVSIYNFALDLPYDKRTGNSVTSTHFEEKEHILYDKGVRLTYLHYIGIGSGPFRRLCSGENVNIPYRDIFLHYRYLHDPEKRPPLMGRIKPFNRNINFLQRLIKKLKQACMVFHG